MAGVPPEYYAMGGAVVPYQAPDVEMEVGLTYGKRQKRARMQGDWTAIGRNLGNKNSNVGYIPMTLWQYVFSMLRTEHFTSPSVEGKTLGEGMARLGTGEFSDIIELSIRDLALWGMYAPEENLKGLLDDWSSNSQQLEQNLMQLQSTVASLPYNPTQLQFQVTNFNNPSFYQQGSTGQGANFNPLPFEELSFNGAMEIEERAMRSLANTVSILSRDLLTMVAGNLAGTTALGNQFVRDQLASDYLANVNDAFTNMSTGLLNIKGKMDGDALLIRTLQETVNRGEAWEEFLFEWSKSLDHLARFEDLPPANYRDLVIQGTNLSWNKNESNWV